MNKNFRVFWRILKPGISRDAPETTWSTPELKVLSGLWPGRVRLGSGPYRLFTADERLGGREELKKNVRVALSNFDRTKTRLCLALFAS